MRPTLLLFFFFFSFTGTSQTNPSEQISKVDFKAVEAVITIVPEKREVAGKMKLAFEVLEELDSIYIDAKNMRFQDVEINGAPVEIYNDNNRLWVIAQFQKSQENTLTFSYNAQPNQTMYFINWNISPEIDASRQVWTQGQGKYTSHWMPSFDDTREKAIFNLSFIFDSDYALLSNGELLEKKVINDSLSQWKFGMENQMSSYLIAVAAGDFEKKVIKSSSGTPISLYYEPQDLYKIEPTYRYSREIFDFMESKTIPYPWLDYKQVPVQDFLYSGMENTGATIFASSLVVDSIGYNDRNYVNVNAHELAHQWFGNYVTAAANEHHWLQEGFGTFYALLAEKELFGEDHYYWKLYETAEEIKALSDNGKGEALLNPRASSLTYYQKGAWALHILKEKVGEAAFDKAVKNYLLNNAYSSVTTSDFLSEVEKTSGMDLTDFERDWLEQSAFQAAEALHSLKNSEFIKNYMEIAALREVPFENKKQLLEKVLTPPVGDYSGQEAVFQLAGPINPNAIALYRRAFNSGNLYVRQAIALSLEKIPAELKNDFESLLEDDSYLTIENALLKLWINFPEETEKWLKKTEGIEGFSNKNVEMLWLVINMVSPSIDKDQVQDHYEKLSSYTREFHPFEVRQNAFGYLYQINAFSTQNLIDLVKAGQHHNTRFRDYSRKLLDELLKKEEYRERFAAISSELSEKDQSFLNKIIKL